MRNDPPIPPIRRRGTSAARLALVVVPFVALAWSGVAAAQSQQRLQPGTYDSYRRRTGPDTQLVPTGRVIKIEDLGLSFRFTVTQNGQLQGSQKLVPTCPPRYDARIASVYQIFKTTPTDPRVKSERLQFVFRQNDIADYDVYYLDQPGPNNSYASEILIRQPK